MKVVVLGGGESVERDISLRSSQAVLTALTAAGYDTTFIDPAEDKAMERIAQSFIVFPILHGAGGEDGTIQSELEHRGLPYLGSDSSASKNCFDKWLTREQLNQAELPIAQGELVIAETYEFSGLRSKPHVLKAVGGGSSIGTLIVRDPAFVDSHKVDEVFEVSDRAVVEELIEGIEITIPILDNDALPVIEIQPPASEEFDYSNKYNGRTREICPPPSISESLQRKVQTVAEKAHKQLRCRHLSRVDMIVKPDGGVVILEINTIPGLTDQSLYPKSALEAGIDMPALMARFVGLVCRDYGLTHV